MSAEWSGSRRPAKRSRQSDDEKGDSKRGAAATAAASGGTSSADDTPWRGSSSASSQQPYGMFPPQAAAGAVPGYPPPMHPARYPTGWPQQPFPPPPMGGPYPMYPTPTFQGGPAGFPPSYQPPHLPPFYQDAPLPPRYPEGGQGGGGGGEEDPLSGTARMPDQEEDSKTPALKRRAKPRTSQDDRRNRKNAQSRARAARLREKIEQIKAKPQDDLTEEEKEQLASFEDRRQRKNDRSRERAIEKKNEMERILAKTERKRTKQERKFLETALKAKQRKNEGDRVRRQRIKQMGLKSSSSSSSRGRTAAQQPLSHHFMPDIPMSPLPTSHHIQSPGTSTFASPGLIRFPSPRGSHATPGVLETPGGTLAESGMPLPFMHQQHYEQPQGATPPARSQLHLPQSSSRVEQRRHPDGSMTISIGRTGTTTGGEFGGESSRLALEAESPIGESNAAGGVNFSDVSQLLLYGDNGEEGEERQAEGSGGGSGKSAEV